MKGDTDAQAIKEMLTASTQGWTEPDGQPFKPGPAASRVCAGLREAQQGLESPSKSR